MAQMTAYRNENPDSKSEVPFLVDVQSDLLSPLGTRVVIPCFRQGAGAPKPPTLTRLTPEMKIDGETLVLMTPQVAGIPRHLLGDPVADLSAHRAEILGALDLLLTGF